MPDRYASLCVLSYNRPEFLRRCIETIHEHADAPFELIVHDDGSLDPRIPSLLDRLYNEGKISLLMRNAPGRNEGQGVALNRMFNAASGDPIIKIDHDVIFQPGWLARVNEILDGNQRAVYQEKSQPWIGLLGLFHYHHHPVDSRVTLLKRYKGWQSHTHICGSAFALRRSAWNDLGPFEERSPAFAEDYVMQRAVTDSEKFVCGLPDEDLLVNQGFGIGPSTVVTGEGQVAEIKPPLVFGLESEDG